MASASTIQHLGNFGGSSSQSDEIAGVIQVINDSGNSSIGLFQLGQKVDIVQTELSTTNHGFTITTDYTGSSNQNDEFEWRSGTWIWNNTNNEGPVQYISLKGGQGVQVLYVPAGYSGSWEINNNTDLSNISFWSTPSAAVPLPGAAWLLGSGLLGLVALRRRQQKK